MKVTLTGQVNVKFRIFKIDLWWIKRKVDETYPINVSGNIIKFNKNNVEFTLSVESSVVKLVAKYGGVQIFTHQFKPEVDLKFPIKFNDRGVYIDLMLAVA